MKRDGAKVGSTANFNLLNGATAMIRRLPTRNSCTDDRFAYGSGGTVCTVNGKFCGGSRTVAEAADDFDYDALLLFF